METPMLLSAYFAAIDNKCLNADVVAATFLPDSQGDTTRRGRALTGQAEILAEQNKPLAPSGPPTAGHRQRHRHPGPATQRRYRAACRPCTSCREPGNSAELEFHFVAGGVLRASARVSTPDGWRGGDGTMYPAWRTGATAGHPCCPPTR